ncbi:phycobilisome linker polypeptide [Calothrix sp. NIES-2098]|uniref:phycobilisome linker polypeptide n=1 Tax=Calothrix sp. NIES-2098 TaxID=1954171 RepID=UPI000B6132E1|nr:rod linker polypeptide CpcD [Calothrix sp. NIES-2098]
MASTIVDPGDFSEYSSRHVTIEVTGGCNRGLMRKAKYTKTIPYSCLSQTIQSINRLGGKITSVTLSPSHTQVSTTPSHITESDVLASAHPDESVFSFPQPQEQKHPDDTCEIVKPTPAPQEKEAIPARNAVSNSVEYTFTEEW